MRFKPLSTSFSLRCPTFSPGEVGSRSLAQKWTWELCYAIMPVRRWEPVEEEWECPYSRATILRLTKHLV